MLLVGVTLLLLVISWHQARASEMVCANIDPAIGGVCTVTVGSLAPGQSVPVVFDVQICQWSLRSFHVNSGLFGSSPPGVWIAASHLNVQSGLGAVVRNESAHTADFVLATVSWACF